MSTKNSFNFLSIQWKQPYNSQKKFGYGDNNNKGGAGNKKYPEFF